MKKNRINTKTGGVSVKESAFGAGKYGGPREDRTPNPLIKSQDCIAINICFLTTYPVSAKV